jgi:hypothetical protein
MPDRNPTLTLYIIASRRKKTEKIREKSVWEKFGKVFELLFYSSIMQLVVL